jgi:hypothetical protein
VQTADHIDRQPSTAVEHFRDASAAAQDSLQVLACEGLLLHPEFDRLDRIRRIDRMLLVLMGVDQRSAHIEPISLWRARARTPQPLDLRKGGLVIRFASDRLDFTQDRVP